MIKKDLGDIQNDYSKLIDSFKNYNDIFSGLNENI